MMDNWISVKDEMPAHKKHVLIYHKGEDRHSLAPTPICTAIWNEWDDEKWFMGWDKEIGEVTHWMPLPEAPMPENTRNILLNIKTYCKDQLALLKITGESYESMSRLKQIQKMLDDIKDE